MEKSIRVQILGRTYPLRVRRDEDEAAMRRTAAHVEERMQAFKRMHPEQPDIVASVVTALALAEELYALREQQAAGDDALDDALDALDRRLADALDAGPSAAPPSNGQPLSDDR